MKDHTLPKVSQLKRRLSAVSSSPQAPMHIVSSVWRTRCLAKLSFVGSRSWKSLQANNDTFNGTCLCHTVSNTPLSKCASTIVIVNKIKKPPPPVMIMSLQNNITQQNRTLRNTLLLPSKEAPQVGIYKDQYDNK